MNIANKNVIAAILLLLFFAAWALIPGKYKIVNEFPQGESIVAFGDSLTYGTGASKGMDYPSQFSQLAGESVINLGIPGDTTLSALQRIDDVLMQNPRIVMITLGGNDLKNGVDKKVAFKNLRIIVKKIQSQGALVILGGLEIPLFGRDYTAAYENLAKETGSVLVPNVFESIMGEAGKMSDRIHPNNRGYGIMAQHFYTAAQPYL